jgi:DNA-directed RNA polymerase subunit M/transcription elongation factor TFIIS
MSQVKNKKLVAAANRTELLLNMYAQACQREIGTTKQSKQLSGCCGRAVILANVQLRRCDEPKSTIRVCPKCGGVC